MSLSHVWSMLICPQTQEPLRLLSQESLKKLNFLIQAQQIQNLSGQLIRAKLDAALVSGQQRFIYPIVENIPVLLAEESIPADKLDNLS